MKIKVELAQQPGSVVVATEITPEMFLGKKVVVLKDEDGKNLDFCFSLKSSGETSISPKFVEFVGTNPKKPLVARVPSAAFGTTKEEITLALGDIVGLSEKLEGQIKAAYQLAMTNASKIEVEE